MTQLPTPGQTGWASVLNDYLAGLEAQIGAGGGGGGGLFRGEWAADAPAYTYTPSGAIGTSFTVFTSGTGSVATASVTGPGGSAVDVMRLKVGGNSGATARVTLALADLGVTGVTRVAFQYTYTGLYLGLPTYRRVRKNGATLVDSNAAVSTWTEQEITTDADDTVEFEVMAAGSNGGVDAGIFDIYGFTVYATADPYMLGEFVVHAGKLWKSDSDNNAGEPGVSGWTEVPLDYADTSHTHDYATSDHTHGDGLFRGEWASDALVWSHTDFTALPAALTTAVGTGTATSSTVADAGMPNPPASSSAMKFYSENANYDAKMTLDLAVLGLTGVTRVVAYTASKKARANYAEFTVLKNGVVAETRAVPHGWEATEVLVDSDDTVTWRSFYNSSMWVQSSCYVAQVEVYAAADPYMQGEYVLYSGKLWKSDTDNNAGEPGVAGWTEVPLDYATSDHTHGTTGGRDVRWVCPSTMTTIDEFSDDSLSGAWAQVNPAGATAANAEWTELADVLSVGNLGGDSTGTIRAQVRSVGTSMVAGDAFVTCQTLQAPAALYTMGGLVLSTTGTVGGDQMALIAYRGTSFAVGSWSFASWAGASAIVANTHSANSITDGVALHMRLVYLGGTTWRADISSDGVTWRKSETFAKASFTPTHVGVLSSSWGSATQGAISYDYLRRQSGIT